MNPSPAEDEKLAPPARLRSLRPDFATIGGLVVGLGGIVAGLVLEGGKVSDVRQITAAVIVLGGTLGAVIGLIQVMKHLENIDEVGRGIAVAFVATVYGVGAANLFFLPAANKLKARIHQDVVVQELLLEGVGSIVEGMNPRLIRIKLE